MGGTVSASVWRPQALYGLQETLTGQGRHRTYPSTRRAQSDTGHDPGTRRSSTRQERITDTTRNASSQRRRPALVDHPAEPVGRRWLLWSLFEDSLQLLTVLSAVGIVGAGAGAFACVRQRSRGFVALEPMTTRSSRSVPAAVVYGTAGSAGAATVAVRLATVARAGHDGSDVGVIDYDSSAFEALGQLPDEPGWAAGRRSAIDGDGAGS